MNRCNFDRRFRGHKLETSNWNKAIDLFVIDKLQAELTGIRTNCIGPLGFHTVQWRTQEFCSGRGFNKFK